MPEEAQAATGARPTHATARATTTVAGVVAALVGFTSSFAVVLAGLRAVGASDAEAASGLFALCVAMALGMLVLTWRYRLPVTLAWSTPGAAVLAGTQLSAGWSDAVGAFVVTALLLLLTAAWPGLGALVARIPAPIAHAMLAGVLLPLCLAPVLAAVDTPGFVLPGIVVWLLLLRVAPRWAVPGAFAVTLVLIVGWLIGTGRSVDGPLLPHVAWTVPTWSPAALIGIAVPLYVVTMAAQNVPGVAVMASYGYPVPWRPSMLVTGLGTLVSAPAGGHAVNLAAITAALVAGDDAGPDPDQRWRAARAVGWTYLVLAVLSAALVALVVAAPDGVVAAVAGLALLGTLGSSLRSALAPERGREAAVVTFVVAAAGVTLGGVGSAFWALAVGVVVHVLLARREPSRVPSAAR
ncbi:benzoate membrane transport protein [Mumia flava]|uniref:Benzoate membrane transport protein n=1 Tax=Mumia flava TaxID=1348852 RepID=A0A0B2B709_9ACTN|nr:benzoate/H(+) symporter BenE family transporter [Mumia flava]PJJ53929.1 benzoate membrane transport protein [Mumia flava]